MRKIAVLAALAMAFALTTPLAPASGGGGGHGPRVSQTSAGVRVEFDRTDASNWTAQRMRSAVPRTFRPDLAGTAGRAKHQRVAGGPVAVRATQPARFFSHVGYTRTQVADPTIEKLRTHGKLFMSLQGGGAAVCSGTVVSSANKLTVVTAAHCIFGPDDAQFITDAAFAPGYDNGVTPFGLWPVEEALITQEWFDSTSLGTPDARFDVGVMKLHPLDNMLIEDVVGARGIMFHLDQTQEYQSYGYPAADPFDGELMWTCDSEPGGALISPDGPPFVNGMGCDMTGGSSGGGWIIHDEYVNSVVSFGLENDPDSQYGPYFGVVARDLYEFVGETTLPEPAVDPPEVKHKTKLTMKLKGHLKATGKVTSKTGAVCRSQATVAIFKKQGKTFKQIKVVLTKANGSYSTKLKDKPGYYAALVVERYADSFNLCKGFAQKKATRHTH